jgi:hypothetical protein
MPIESCCCPNDITDSNVRMVAEEVLAHMQDKQMAAGTRGHR